MTKVQRGKYESYCRSTDYSLYDCYGSFSHAKARAWEYCENLCRQKEGWGLKVVGHNSCFFSAGFLYEESGKQMYMHITASKDEPIEITEEE